MERYQRVFKESEEYLTFDSKGMNGLWSTTIIKGYKKEAGNYIEVYVDYGIFDYNPNPKHYYPSNRIFSKSQMYKFEKKKIRNIRSSSLQEIKWMEKIIKDGYWWEK